MSKGKANSEPSESNLDSETALKPEFQLYNSMTKQKEIFKPKEEGYEVVCVRNLTDVDDKIINRANECGEDPIALSGRFCEEYLRDMDDLQCSPPTHQPRVSDHIETITEMIDPIIKNGCAYQVDGVVYFSIDSFPNYRRVSAQNVEGNKKEKSCRLRIVEGHEAWLAKLGQPVGSWKTWMAYRMYCNECSLFDTLI